MKYLVKNRKTGEETLCEKVEVGGWFYYVAGKANKGDYGYLNFQGGDIKIIGKYFADDWLKVIATNNKSLTLPMVIDEVEELAENHARKNWALCFDENFSHNTIGGRLIDVYKVGYSKAKETYSYTKEDLINFKQQAPLILEQLNGASDSDLFDIWQEQRIKTIIVE